MECRISSARARVRLSRASISASTAARWRSTWARRAFGLAAGQGQGLGLEPVQEAGAILDQSAALNLQFLEFMLVVRHRPVRLQRERRPHCRQHPGIDGVGLCPRPACLRKASCLKRVDLAKRQMW